MKDSKTDYFDYLKQDKIANSFKSSSFFQTIYLNLLYLLKKSSVKLDFSIPKNVFGPGLPLVQYGVIVVNY